MNNLLFAVIVNGIVFIAWLILLSKDKEKGLKAIKIGGQTIFSMLPLILIIVGSIGVLSSFISPDQISNYLGDRAGIKGFFFISVVSSFLQIPGIVAFPIAATLRQSGAAIGTVAVFACASTMASVFTLPIEMKYLGKKLPFIRTGFTYVISVAVGLLTGLIFRFL
jgi:uncharacterized membrane protein YraQ (UPF0718 family)